MEDNFFEDANYKIPETSNYMKLTEGSHTFRIMSSAIVGYEYFNTENKPTRSKEMFEEIPLDIKKGGRINHFWAFAIWNYDAKKLQIMEVTQKSIMAPLKALIENSKWGNPKKFDITITRKGTGMQDTEYSVLPNPHSEIPEDAKQAYMNNPVNLEALYANGDPFAK